MTENEETRINEIFHLEVEIATALNYMTCERQRNQDNKAVIIIIKRLIITKWKVKICLYGNENLLSRNYKSFPCPLTKFL